MSNLGVVITRRANRIRETLSQLGLKEDTASEVAFHLADSEKDFALLRRFLERAVAGRRLTKKDVVKLSELLDTHTHYHWMNLRKSLRKAAKEHPERGTKP